MWIVMLIVIITQIIFTIQLCCKDKSLTTSIKTKHPMQNFLKNLKRSYWVSGDGDITLSFDDLKGIATVKVREYKGRTKECVYVLQPTTSDRLATFDTLNGRFTIAIADGGDELFISPLGIFLYDYSVSKTKNEDATGIDPKDDNHVINVSLV